MIGEGICVSQGQVLKHLMNDIPKRNLGLVTLHRGQLVNKKIRHTNRNEHDVHYKLVSDSPLIYFRQRSNFEVIADCNLLIAFFLSYLLCFLIFSNQLQKQTNFSKILNQEFFYSLSAIIIYSLYNKNN
ncbi:transmembrane protein, putative (macronuclear) [Tetrahymena thermophila SB210]|uniref:Transmembrane protein, putative n=1 Tax=Tetrahymena thermophila (strain SB210) TaxID=312017 RepID=I7MKI1_TETTS|nr:transmembrane protein, putative [Tetrahymena thermophila SB210]EAR98468.2 transmembrane protein, putative [Tetrahymena thermophila SB210]|eukprot:XP_001018713.2 transmembrane protein, putative [Tetrahymena thermophila SB210]